MEKTYRLEDPFDPGEGQPGYHLRKIPCGEFGELSKIREEISEAEDMLEQGCRIGVLVELSDAVGAISGVLARHFPDTSMEDLLKMAELTKRAFDSGQR